MKKKILDVEIKYTKFPAMGYAIEGEKVYRIKNALPYEKLKIITGRKRGDYIEGKVLEYLNPSPLKTKDPCPHRPKCGGCLYDALPYEDEIALKEKELRDLFSRFDFYEGLEVVGEPLRYRNKMEFTFGNEYAKGPLTLGLHQKGMFHNIISVPHCTLCDSDFISIRNMTEDFFRKNNIPFYHRRKNEGALRHLMIRKGLNTGEILLVLSHTSEYVPLREWIDELKKISLKGEIKSIYHVINDKVADAIKGSPHLLYGEDSIKEIIFGLSFNISPYSFFQTNTLGAEKLYKRALGFISNLKDKTVFDLYSGTGTIASIVAKEAKKVYAIEIVSDAVREGKKSAKENNLEITFLEGDVFKMLDEIDERPDIIIVDPPREGIIEKTLRKIAGYNVPEILYISCNPLTLNRDLILLEEEGYKTIKLVSMDMFPRTPNVETIALVSKDT